MQSSYPDILSLRLGTSKQELILTGSVLSHLCSHRQLRWHQKEAGGQLFARFALPQIEVVSATGPRRTDRRTRCGYVPDRRKETEEIKLMHKAGLHFVGDWHTHPQDIPSPSGLDIVSLQECYRESKHDLNAFILIVVGRAPFPAGLYVAAVDAKESYQLRLST